MKSRIVIDDQDVAFNQLLPISTNLSVADIREPGKSKGHYTKTIVIPGTPQANQLFEYAFDCNIESDSFNANLALPAKYYVNEVKVYEGKLQLIQINKRYDGEVWAVEYECSIVGETGNIFLDISQLFLTDIDFSDLDHPFTYASGLFNPTLGTGYCYPYIDYGVQGDGTRVGATWTFEHLKPAIFEKEYIDRIFEDAGYTYTSTYLNSAYEKSIIIPCVSEGALQLPIATMQNNQFSVNTGAVVSGNLASTGYVGNQCFFQDLVEDPVPYDNEVIDPGGVYDSTTFIFSPGISATYTITATIDLNLVMNHPGLTATVDGQYDIDLTIYKSTNAGGSWSAVRSHTFSAEMDGPVQAASNPKMQVDVPPTMYTLPCIFKVVLSVTNINAFFYASGGGPVTGGSPSVDYSYTGLFGAVVSSGNLPSGQTVVMNDTIPTNVKQLDFLTSIIKAENLYIEVDKENPNNYIIEPREDFINTDVTDALDWTLKLDTRKPIKIKPMGELNAKRYLFTYAQDEDFYNKLYYDEFKEVYGTERIDINSDFVNEEKKIELIFAATPTAAPGGTSAGTDIVAARFFKGDLSAVEPMKCKIRRLYWGGLIPCSSHQLITEGYQDFNNSGVYTNPNAVAIKTEYPFAGHVDDPMDPTIDLTWDNPLRLYWVYPNQTYTDNQRYNARYSKFINEISHRDSKIVTAYFFLNEKDISEFSFRNLVFVDGTYYFVNEIKDYDPQGSESIPVELLKLQQGDPFTPTHAQNINDIMGGGTFNNARTGASYSSANNYGIGTSFGTSNTNNSVYALVIGNGNIVG